MIDLIKYFVTDRKSFINKVEESNKVDLRVPVNFKTGEILDKKTASYNNMFIEITNNRATLKGSIHKYHNINEGFGKQNYNDFSYCDFKHAINDLQSTFQISNADTYVTNLEFGLNIITEKDPKVIIDNSVLMYNFKTPNRKENFYGKGNYLEFKTTDYSIKIYNKSKQNFLKDINILRVELKITGARYLKRHFNINTLNDLDRNRFEMLFDKLLEHFDKLLIVDSLIIKNYHRIDEMVLFQNGINPSYWTGLRNEKKYKDINRFKEDFESVLENYDLLKIKKQLKTSLKNKFKSLMNCDCEILKKVA